ncbi:dihydrofolate reductase family protein [Micromonospora sp. ATA32]|nr:dihydrofolate reductase family protein [Micromonospora sp. ATA32]
MSTAMLQRATSRSSPSPRLFDMTNGWGGRHPMDVPVVVVTHSVPKGWERENDWFVFVTDGTIAAQVIQAGLLDEVHVDLVPVLLGDGSPLFADLKIAPVQPEGPTSVVEGKGVTHLAYKVQTAG